MHTPLYSRDLKVLSSHWTGDWSVYFNYALARGVEIVKFSTCPYLSRDK